MTVPRDDDATVSHPAVTPPASEDLPSDAAEAVAPQPIRRRAWPYLVGLLLAVLGGGYLAGYLMADDSVPSRTTVAGVAIGGQNREQAIATLKDQLGHRSTAEIQVRAAAKTATVCPGDAGLAVDHAATVAASGVGRSWSPIHIWRVLTGGGVVDPVLAVDQPRFTAAVSEVAANLGTRPVDASLNLHGTQASVTAAVTGVSVDQAATAQAITAAYLTTTHVTAVTTTTEPQVTTAQAQAVADGWLAAALSGPITLDTGKGTFTITAEAVAAAVSFPVRDGSLTPQVDYPKLFATATEAMKALQLGAPVDATIGFGPDGKPAVTASKDGLTVTVEKFAQAVAPLLDKPADQKRGPVEASLQRAAFTTEAAQALGVKEVIGEFTTEWPHADYRNKNIGKAAAGVNGTLLKPGEIFSLNKILGPRTAANGYVDGYVIQGGALVKETGGGISQSATTIYNAMFFAGLKDIEHHPHMFYIDRYPAGREATVYYGSLDLRFQNDTPYGVLVQAFISPSASGRKGSVTVRMWSTKTYDEVRSSELVRSHHTSPTTRRSTSPTCEPQGQTAGFDVTYSRLFLKGGQVVREEKFFWRYSPQDRIVCGSA